MKKLTKVSAVCSLLFVLAIPITAKAAVNGEGTYWPSMTTVTQYNVNAYAENGGGSIFSVESDAFNTSNYVSYAYDSGSSWSRISIARPGSSGMVINSCNYARTNNGYTINNDQSTAKRF